MLNEPRTYRHPVIQFIFLILILGVFAFLAFMSLDGDSTFLAILPIGLITVILGIYLVIMITSKTTVSDTEISSQNLLGTKTLGWSEINSVSGSGYGIKLHNFDGDVTVAPSPQLPGYEEVIEFIGTKRPDLFAPQEDGKMTKGWASAIISVVVALAIAGFGATGLMGSDQWFMAIFFAVIGLVILATIFSSPQSVTIEGKSLFVKYLLSQRTLPADEIRSIELKYQRTRNGRTYFVMLNLMNGRSLRISGLKPGLPIVYLTLKNWHGKNIPQIANRDIF
ncbi:MAG: hypothetical protein HZB19_02180 [Chloroflexi bacterium]|nr:hypothetical protein [Chloroflexota bacterium]